MLFTAFHKSRVIAFRHFRAGRSLSSFVSAKNTAYNSMKDKNFFISTPIYYVNGLPHLGHAYTSAMCDIIARYHRKDEANVFFLSGTDEHGQKVEQSAVKAGKTPIEFSNEVSNSFKELLTSLHCTHDDFIRTTEPRHMDAVVAFWKRLEANGQIYLGAYEGWYSVRDEAFYSDLELVDGNAPTGAPVEWVREESYFFRLSEYTDKLLAFYEENPDFIAPRGKRNEVVSFLKQEGGLKDLSISRTTFSWGIPVPGNPKHVMYVWLDALTNYISALGFPDTEGSKFQQFWPASVHVVGKDILRFHAIYWPAFLMAAEIEPPKVSKTCGFCVFYEEKDSVACFVVIPFITFAHPLI
jgi:methionyl-tRNA synthetase